MLVPFKSNIVPTKGSGSVSLPVLAGYKDWTCLIEASEGVSETSDAGP